MHFVFKSVFFLLNADVREGFGEFCLPIRFFFPLRNSDISELMLV